MVSFIIDESHLRQLSAEARSELLQIIGAELADLENEFADREWDPEENKSYPLSTDEAKVLIRGLDRPAGKGRRHHRKAAARRSALEPGCRRAIHSCTGNIPCAGEHHTGCGR